VFCFVFFFFFHFLCRLQSCDGEIFDVSDEVVEMCATVKNMLKGKSAFRNSLGGQFSIDGGCATCCSLFKVVFFLFLFSFFAGSYVILKKEGRVLASLIKNDEHEAVVTLPDVKSHTLRKIMYYCKFHSCLDCSERERKIWNQEFVQVKQSVLCELASASYYLDIKPLVNLTSRAIATQISGKSPDEIQETFCNINYEVYAPVFASSLATRCRLQRKYNKKKQEKDQKMLTAPQTDDSRSLDDLLSFINDDQPTTKKKSNKKKKKKGQKAEKENSEEDDDLDPEKEAALDKEVEDFRQLLESINSQNVRGDLNLFFFFFFFLTSCRVQFLKFQCRLLL